MPASAVAAQPRPWVAASAVAGLTWVPASAVVLASGSVDASDMATSHEEPLDADTTGATATVRSTVAWP